MQRSQRQSRKRASSIYMRCISALQFAMSAFRAWYTWRHLHILLAWEVSVGTVGFISGTAGVVCCGIGLKLILRCCAFRLPLPRSSIGCSHDSIDDTLCRDMIECSDCHIFIGRRQSRPAVVALYPRLACYGWVDPASCIQSTQFRDRMILSKRNRPCA